MSYITGMKVKQKGRQSQHADTFSEKHLLVSTQDLPPMEHLLLPHILRNPYPSMASYIHLDDWSFIVEVMEFIWIISNPKR